MPACLPACQVLQWKDRKAGSAPGQGMDLRPSLLKQRDLPLWVFPDGVNPLVPMPAITNTLTLEAGAEGGAGVGTEGGAEAAVELSAAAGGERATLEAGVKLEAEERVGAGLTGPTPTPTPTLPPVRPVEAAGKGSRRPPVAPHTHAGDPPKPSTASSPGPGERVLGFVWPSRHTPLSRTQALERRFQVRGAQGIGRGGPGYRLEGPRV